MSSEDYHIQAVNEKASVPRPFISVKNVIKGTVTKVSRLIVPVMNVDPTGHGSHILILLSAWTLTTMDLC